MNERINELAVQAGIPKIDGEWDYNDRTLLKKEDNEWRPALPSEIISTMMTFEHGLEKFAELIVRECAELCLKHDTFQGLFHEMEYRKGRHFNTMIKAHFGVKE